MQCKRCTIASQANAMVCKNRDVEAQWCIVMGGSSRICILVND